MTAVKVLRHQAEVAFAGLLDAIEGVDEPQAWGILPDAGGDYLHTDGSIQGIVLHIAGGKRMYGSCGFRNAEVKWTEVAAAMEAFEPSWPAAVEYLKDSHSYWMSAWRDLDDADLEGDVPHFRGRLVPAWKCITTVIHHDEYHAGQIAMIRYGATPSTTPPPSSAADIREHCKDLPHYSNQ